MKWNRLNLSLRVSKDHIIILVVLMRHWAFATSSSLKPSNYWGFEVPTAF